MPFVSRKPPLVLDEDTRSYLQTVSVSRTAPAAHVERGGMLLAYAEGARVTTIARLFHTNRVKVNDTVNRALQVGARAALRDLPRAGRQRTIPEEARAWVVSLACRKPKELGYSEELWTTRLLAQHVQRHCEAADNPSLRKLGRGTVSKLLREQEVKPHKIQLLSGAAGSRLRGKDDQRALCLQADRGAAREARRRGESAPSRCPLVR